jgi:hypothetical protein
MTDYRDLNYRDPDRPAYRDPHTPMGAEPWSNATWGWIAGIAVVVLVLIFAFGTDRTDVAVDNTSPPATVGQRPAAPPPSTGMTPDAPTARPLPAPAPAAPEPAAPEPK